MRDKIIVVVDWFRSMFQDPTSGMHAMGFGTVGFELIRSWYTHTPLDMQKVEVGFGLFAGGFVGDRFIAPQNSKEG